MNRGRAVLARFAVSCAIFTMVHAGRHDTMASAADTGAKPQAAINDLRSALPLIYWESRVHGPLIAIAPDKVHWQRPTDNDGGAALDDAARTQLFAPQDRYGLSADIVARHFRLKLIRLSTMTVFAPLTMISLRVPNRPADPFLQAGIADKLYRLGATLTPAQWQRLGSVTGLGMTDIRRDQKPLFEDVLPETMRIRDISVIDAPQGSSRRIEMPGVTRTLSPQERIGIRLHMVRTAYFGLLDAADREHNRQIPFQSPFRSTLSGSKELELRSEVQTLASRSQVSGQAVRVEEPNRLKASDIDLKQSIWQDTYVPVTTVKTVGDLLHAVQTATGVELHADGRLAGLTVAVSSSEVSVRAADILEALCWSLTATYRKVGPIPGGDPKDSTYVLTYDRTGLTKLRSEIAEWTRHGMALREANRRHFSDDIKKQKPGKYLSFAKGDLLAPTPAALARSRKSEETVVPISDLTPVQRQQMSDGLRRLDAERETARANRSGLPEAQTDRVSLWTAFGLAFVIPGAGQTRTSTIVAGDDEMDDVSPAPEEAVDPKAVAQGRSDFLKSLRMGPVQMSDAIVCIAPKTAEEAVPLFAAAHYLGIGEIWVSTPDSRAGFALLTACAALGKANGVRVGAQVALADLIPDEGDASSALEDLNIRGETGRQWSAYVSREASGNPAKSSWYLAATPVEDHDWLAPDAPGTRIRLRRWMEELASIPGLTTITFRHAAGPGHDWTRASDQASDIHWDGELFGYTVANRLAFLRRVGYDPIDFPSATDVYGYLGLDEALRVPHFDTDGSNEVNLYYAGMPDLDDAMNAWRKQCGDATRELLLGLRQAMNVSHPGLNVYLSAFDGADGGPGNAPILLWRDLNHVPFSPDNTQPNGNTQAPPPKMAGVPELLPLNAFRLTPEVIEGLRQDRQDDIAESNAFDFPLGAYVADDLRGAYDSIDNSVVKGMLLDVTQMNISDALPLLQGAVRAAPSMTNVRTPAHSAP